MLKVEWPCNAQRSGAASKTCPTVLAIEMNEIGHVGQRRTCQTGNLSNRGEVGHFFENLHECFFMFRWASKTRRSLYQYIKNPGDYSAGLD